MTNVRLGLIGLGNIGQHHAAYLSEGKVNRAELVAVCDPKSSKLGQYDRLKAFTEGETLIASGLVDAVIVATPHYQHTSLGIAAIERGLHVMVEKPISAHKADAERLIASHRNNSRLVFAAMFQLRAEPRYLKIRQLIESGELGQLVRICWLMTDWFRTEAYYESGGWRATWKGEGGGVLLNQCLHNLDLLQWLVKMPVRVRGFCKLGRFHHVEVEDDVTAYFEYSSGATGTLTASTGESPGSNRLEIVGTRGRLVLERDRLWFDRNAADVMEFSKAAKLGFAKPEVSTVEIPFENAVHPHAAVMQNFVDAILDGSPLIAPGAEGIHSLEFANAILYSSLMGQTVELPLDSRAYERKLSQLIAGSKIEKKAAVISNEDFSKSFKR